MSKALDHAAIDWGVYIERYRKGESRAGVFHDLIAADADQIADRSGALTFLDIGCGGGFDNDPNLQASLAKKADRYIGIEPDTDVELGDIFTATYRGRFEEAPIQADSIDIAFAVMVLEHLADPQPFWDKVYTVLRRDGIFWGFTIDARHWFAGASLLAKKMQIADLYLNALHSSHGPGRYKNYPVYYRSNTPSKIMRLTSMFRTQMILNFQTVGQLNYYLPNYLRGLSRAIDRAALRKGWPGTIIAVRVTK